MFFSISDYEMANTVRLTEPNLRVRCLEAKTFKQDKKKRYGIML